MNEVGAHHEANMIRAKLNIDPATHKMEDWVPEKEPSAEDYEEALQAIDKLKELAEKDPSIAQTALQVFRGLGKIAIASPSLVLATVLRVAGAALHEGNIQERTGKAVIDDTVAWVFDDARSQIKRLQSKSEKLAN